MGRFRAAMFAALIAGALLGRPDPMPPEPPGRYLEVKVPGRPYALTIAGDSVWALTEATAVRIDRASGRITATVPLGAEGYAGDGLTDPLGSIAFGEGAVWVATRTGGSPPGATRTGRGGGVPGVYDPVETFADEEPDVQGLLLKIDPGTATVTERLPLAEGRASHLAVGSGRVFVTSARSLLALDAQRPGAPPEARREIETDARLSFDSGSLWVAAPEGPLRLDPSLGGKGSVPRGAVAVAARGDEAWFVGTDGRLYLSRDGRDRRVSAERFTDVATSASFAWASAPDRGAVAEVQPSTGRVVAFHPGPGRRAGALAAEGSEVWVIGAHGAIGRISV